MNVDIVYTIDFTDVPEVNITLSAGTNTTDGSGSGDSEGIDILPIDSEIESQMAGQVYAYRHNATFVVLGTRKRDVLGAAVGINEISNGKYQCIATNDREQDYQIVDISVQSMDYNY